MNRDPVRLQPSLLPTPPAVVASLEAMPWPILLLDAQANCLYANPAWAKLCELPPETALGLGWAMLVHHANQGGQDVLEQIRTGFAHQGNESALSIEVRLQRPHQDELPVLCKGWPIETPQGRLFALALEDVSQCTQQGQELRQTQERLRRFAEASREAILVLRQERIEDANPVALDLLGLEPGELEGRTILEFLPAGQRTALRMRLLTDNASPFEMDLVHASGERVPVELVCRGVDGLDGSLQLIVMRSLRERRDAEARLRHAAHHDTLTGLPNRTALVEGLQLRLLRSQRDAESLALLVLDLDHFKTINDSLGHERGDQLLRISAVRLQKVVLAQLPNALVARVGGDEFVVLCQASDEERLSSLARDIIQALSEPMVVGDYSLVVSPSIGIARSPQDGQDAEHLLKNADAAMYLAKERGRSNFQFFDRALAELAHRQLAVETQLRTAIVREEFTLHYQPQVRTEDGELIGTEALIRWNHPAEGLVGPDRFIPVAEARGLIPAIGSWVLREACRQNRQWQDEGLPCVPVAVNLSFLQFRHRDIATEVAQVLEETGLEGQWLALELTESVLMDDPESIRQTLHRLKDLGVRIAVDDFGTGYSSLAYLKRYPIDKLKVDRSFVKDLPHDPDSIAITSAIVHMARSLKISVIAEGVESAAQMAFMRALGCAEIQGFYISQPCDVAAMTQFFKQAMAAAPRRAQGY